MLALVFSNKACHGANRRAVPEQLTHINTANQKASGAIKLSVGDIKNTCFVTL